MLDINGALKAIGYGLLVLFFAVGVVKTCSSFADLKRPEAAFKIFIRFVLAKAAVGYGLDLMLAVFGIIQGMVATIISQSGLSGSSGATLPQEIIDINLGISLKTIDITGLNGMHKCVSCPLPVSIVGKKGMHSQFKPCIPFHAPRRLRLR